jgi:hypothetical protein
MGTAKVAATKPRAADLRVAFAEYLTALRKVGISYSCRTYEEGKKIGLRDAVRALYCIVRIQFVFACCKENAR